MGIFSTVLRRGLCVRSCISYRLSLASLHNFFGQSVSWKTGIHLLRGDSISLKLFYNSLANYISARRVSNSLFLM